MADTYAIRAILSAVDNLSPVLEQVSGRVQQFGNNVEKNYGSVGKAMVGIGAATTAMGVSSLKSFGQFQQSLNTAAVVAGGTAKDISGLSDVANKMGADLPLSAQEASDAMVEMARNGASVNQIKEQFPAIAQAATAAGSDLQATAGVVQQAMNIWGNSLKSPQQAAEILVQTANMSNASIEDMQQAMATIGGTAKLAGMNLADTSEAIGLLTNKGFSAAQASDDLNHAILQMMAPSSVAKKTMDDLGLSFTDAQGKMKPFPQILSEVAQSLDGMSKSEQTAALKAMFGTAGMQAIAPLLDSIKDKSDNSSTSWAAWAQQVDKVAGSSDKATKSLKDQADEMQKNVGAQIEQLGGNWEALRNTAMASSGGVNGAVLSMMNNTLEWANSSHSGIAKVIRGFIGLSPVIGPAVTAVGGFLTSAGKIASVGAQAAKGLFNMARGALNLAARLLPIGNRGATAGAGLEETASKSTAAGKSASESSGSIIQLGLAILEIGAGVGLATAGMAALVLATSQLAKQGLAGVGTLLAVTAALSALVGVLTIAGKAIGTMGPQTALAYAGMAALVASFALLTAAVTQFAATGKQGIVALAAITASITVLTAVMAALSPVLTAGAAGLLAFGAAVLMVGAGIGIATAGMAMLLNAFNNFNASAQTVVATMTTIGQGFAMMFTTFITTLATQMPIIAQSIMQMLLQILTAFTNFMPQMVTQGALLVTNFLMGIAQNLPMIIDAAVQVIVSFVEGIAANIGQVIAAALDLLEAFVDGIGENIERIVDIAMQAVMEFVYGVGYALGSVIASGGKLIQMFIRGVMNGLSGSRNAGKSNADSTRSGISSVSLVSEGKQLISGFISGIKSMAGAVMEAAASIANAAKAKIQSALKIHSPSRVMRDEVGVYIPAGLAEGMLANIGAVTDAAQRVADAAVVSAPPINTDKMTQSLNTVQAKMQDMSANVSGTLTDNATVTEDVTRRLWQSRMERLMGLAVNKLDNVEQHPVVTVDTLNRMNDYNNKINMIAYAGWKGR